MASITSLSRIGSNDVDDALADDAERRLSLVVNFPPVIPVDDALADDAERRGVLNFYSIARRRRLAKASPTKAEPCVSEKPVVENLPPREEGVPDES